jgi:hypothetical protein
VPSERQSLIGDHRRHADSCEEPRAATRRDDDEHCAEREEGAEYDVSFQGADSTTGSAASGSRSRRTGTTRPASRSSTAPTTASSSAFARA